MNVQLVYPDSAAWDAFVAARPDGHVLQMGAWGELKARFGWQAARLAIADGARLLAGAQVLFRRLPLRLGTLAYVPRGPLLDWENEPLAGALWDALDQVCRARRAALLKVEPECSTCHAPRPAFRPSPHPVQPRRTIVVDLTGGEDDLLARMHPKTRYNVRLAARKGVAVRQAGPGDVATFYGLMQLTGQRDGFGVHSLAYYSAAFDLFAPHDQACLLLAEVGGEAVAGLMVFALPGTGKAWYFYGASGNTHREKMPAYALQWAAMCWARQAGCITYDLWGIPDEDEAVLEAHYLERRDGLWGVYRFKRGFGGRAVRYAGAYDRVYNPVLYGLYLAVLRRRGLETG